MATVDYRMTNFDKIAFIGGLYVGRTTEEVKIFTSAGTFVGSIAPSSLATTGTLSVTGISSLGQVKAQSGLASYSVLFGADFGANTLTNSTTKMGILSVPHYTNAQVPVTGMLVQSTSTNNDVYIGGGTSGNNSATRIFFLTGATTTTTAGTTAGSISSAGAWTLGANNSTSNHLINGNQLKLQADTTGKVFKIVGSDANDAVTYICGASGFSNGGLIALFGNSHATNPNLTQFQNGGSTTGSISSAGAWTLGASGGIQAHSILGASTTLQAANSGNPVYFSAYNSSNTASSSSQIQAEVAGTSAGDAMYVAKISSAAAWGWGLDNSASDAFSLSYNAAGSPVLGTSEFLNISTAGLITLGTGTSTQHALNTLLATNGAQAATLLNLPAAATAGNPAVWIKITVNGATRYIPAWA